MMHGRLNTRFDALQRMLRRARLWRSLAWCWAIAAATGAAALAVQGLTEWRFTGMWALPLVVGIAMVVLHFTPPLWSSTLFRNERTKWRSKVAEQSGGLHGSNTRALRFGHELRPVLDLIREIEPDQPQIRHLLSAAAEQRPDEASGSLGFLQLRVIEEALAHPRHAVWRQQLERRLALARVSHAGALVALLAVVLALHQRATHGAAAFGSLLADEITVTPGDTTVERGTGLVIAARFGGTPPAEAALVLNSGTGSESRIPMARRLADPVFGASIVEVSEAGIYHVEYGGKKTREYKIDVFECPALVRADAELRYPAYTGLTNRTIRDTVRVSAVEGSHLTYTLQLNKPVTRAQLVDKEQSLALARSNSVAVLPDFCLTNSARYSLELVDAEGRSNKFPTEFVFQALTNQRPDVRLVFPRGDARVSPLQELQLQAEASDDFGLLKYGIGFGVAGQEPRLVELGQAAPANVKQQFEYLITLEKLGVEVDQAVAYFAWADDYGPDSQPRRTFSDMFFAEVRPFEEVFRADQSGSMEGESQQGNQGGGNERVRLTELQKQIVIATWNLQRQIAGTSTLRSAATEDGRAPQHP